MIRVYFTALLNDGTFLDLDNIMVMGQEVYFGKYSALMNDEEKKRTADEIRELMSADTA